jgi:GDP-6-deoxy-D-talose 4-dehydrogenase
MPKALITGINGFTGRYLADELRATGYEVFGLGFGVVAENDKDIFACDLYDKISLANIVGQVKPDVVIHLAAIAFAAHDDIEAIYRTNLIGTRNLIESVADCCGADASILIASSANIYGNATAEIIVEEVLPAPANDYAVSKLAMEYVAKLWADKLRITIVRPFNYTGVGQSINFLLPKLIDHFKRRAPVIDLGNINIVRDFSDVRTVVACYHRLLKCDTNFVSGEVFNMCSGVGHSLLDVIEMMREISGHSPKIRVNPAFVRANEVNKLVGSRAKLENAIGFVNATPLRDTLKWMYESL